MREPLLEIARLHPEYGYRRTTSELSERGYHQNRKVIQRLHRCWDLSIVRRIKKPGDNPVWTILQAAGSQVNLVAGLEHIGELEVLYTDFTEIRYQRGMTPSDEELYRRTDEVLHYVWDPIGVAEAPTARDEYYSYLPQVFGLLKANANTEKIADYLYKISTEQMGLNGNREHDLRIAEVLLDWKRVILEKHS